MASRVREGLGAALVLCALAALWMALDALREQQFVATVLLLTTGLSVLRAGVELLRPSVGE